MNTPDRTSARLPRFLLLLACLGAMSACGAGQTPEPATDKAEARQTHSMLGNVVAKAMDEARNEIRTGNLSISADSHDLPKAEISPQGDLLVDGRKVDITPAQRALLLDYRGHLLGIAESGMDIGLQGADLAAKAMGEAFKGMFTGKSEAEIEQSIESEADGIKAAAVQLCDRLPAMLASQRQLAAALPEFAPYATMDESDIDDCMDDHDDGAPDARRAQQREEIRAGIRNGIRGSIQKATQSTGLASRDDTDAKEAQENGAAATE
jgi:hypothetical protein